MPATPPAIVTLADSPVPYKFLRNGPPTLDGDLGGWTATMSFLVASGDMFEFCEFCGGTVKTVDMGGGVTAQRIIPLSHPFAPKLLCQGVSARMTGNWVDTLPDWCKQFSLAKVDVTFRTVPYQTDGGAPFLVMNNRGASQSYSLAGSKMSFPSDGTPIQADASLNVPILTYSATIYQAVGPGDDVVAPLMGTVNNATLTLGAFPMPAGTFRFDTMDNEVSTTVGSVKSYQRTLMGSFRPVPWNYFLRPNGLWEVALKPNGDPVYAPADHSVLFS